MRFMTRLRVLFPLLFALLAWSSLKAQQPELRAINLLPDSGPLDLFIADTMQPRIVNLEYGSASSIFPTTPGQAMLIITPSNVHSQTLVSTTVSASQSYRNELLLLGSAGNIDVTSLQFTAAFQPSPDSIYVRFFHSNPNIGPVDGTIIDADGVQHPLGASYKSMSEYVRVPRGHLELQLFPSGSSSALVDVAGNLGGGSFVTIFFTGLGSGMRVQAFTENNPGPQQPMFILSKVVAPPPAPFNLRLVNLVDSSGSASLTIDTASTPLVKSVAYRGASAVVSSSMGSRLLKAVADISATSLTRTFSSDSSYTAFWIGTKATHELLIASRSASMPAVPADSVRVRVLDAMPGTGSARATLLVDSLGVGIDHSITYRSLTDYEMIPAGRFVLVLLGSKNYQATTLLAGGSTITLVLSGSEGSTAVNILRDDDGSAQDLLPMLRSVDNGNLRLVNVTPLDSITVHSSHNQNNGRLLHPFEAAAPLRLFTFDYTLQVVPSGQPVSSALLDQSVSIPGADTNRSYVILPGEHGAQFTSLVLDQGADDLPANSTPLRWVNAVPDIGPINVNVQFQNSSSTLIPNLVFASPTSFDDLPSEPVRVTITQGPTTLADLEGTLPLNEVVTAFVARERENGPIQVYLMHEGGAVAADENPMIKLTPVEAAVPGASLPIASNLSIIPNPASSSLLVRVTADIAGLRGTVLVTDLLGMTVKKSPFDESSLAGGTLKLDVADLPAGSYGLEIRDDNGALRATSRFTVVR